MLWDWLNESPSANFHDGGIKSQEELVIDFDNRYLVGERVYEVLKDGVPVGCIGIAPVHKKRWTISMFRGICFTKSECGTGTAIEAIKTLLKIMPEIESIYAFFFSDNERVRAFFKKLGSVEAGRGQYPVMRQGKEITYDCIRLDNNEIHGDKGLRTNQKDCLSSKDLLGAS